VNCMVIGTDHRFQEHDAGLEALLRTWTESRFFEPLTAIAEEYHERLGKSSIAQRIAAERHVDWLNIDMTIQEKQEAGIFEEQSNRPGMFQANVTYRVLSDDIREEAWIRKMTQSISSGTTIVVCGYLHCASLVQKLRALGHSVDQRIYLESVPEIRCSQ